MDGFDADVLIYAGVDDHPLGRRVVRLFEPSDSASRVGSLLLLPEVLTKPIRRDAAVEIAVLSGLLGRMRLHPLDTELAQFAVTLGARYRLRAADAVHLATAITVGADRFITNNRRAFPKSITEVDVVYPDELPEPDL